ncbi:MAG: peptidylprolyl isomerase [Cycloclasticus sp.]|nr:peptidylprolyl isomerase [Cycloclasticus sp.]MBQ0790583.1 peptidylprolyl isomerase [Cycloclasticus sp.]
MSLAISKDTVVQFHYTLKNDQGETLESSLEQQPTAILFGRGGIIPGVENAIDGKQAGDTLNLTVKPKEGYGERIDDSIQSVPVKHLSGAKKWRPGMVASVQTDHGQRQVTVVKVGKFMVKVDTNHPLAGQTLHFDIEIVDVRAATAEELAHGHAHGAGGHHH